MKWRFALIFLAVLLVTFMPLVHANDEGQVNLTDLPQKVADALGTSLLGGQLLVSTILLMLCVLPFLLVTRNILAHVIISFMVLSVCLGLGWLPFWIFILISLGVGLLFAGSVRNMISGKGGEG